MKTTDIYVLHFKHKLSTAESVSTFRGCTQHYIALVLEIFMSSVFSLITFMHVSLLSGSEFSSKLRLQCSNYYIIIHSTTSGRSLVSYRTNWIAMFVRMFEMVEFP